jgi:hypothetical protein
MSLNHKLRGIAAKFVKADSQASDEDVVVALIALIHEPQKIENTNDFASLLADIGDSRFIEPLICDIASGVPSQTSWHADYMYALIELLESCDSYYVVDEDVVHLLGNWLLNTQGGEISWKAGDILSQVECPASKEYLMKGAADTSLFHLTRISCVRGIVNHFSQDARSLLLSLEGDSSQEVKEACQGAMIHLDRIEERAQ